MYISHRKGLFLTRDSSHDSDSSRHYSYLEADDIDAGWRLLAADMYLDEDETGLEAKRPPLEANPPPPPPPPPSSAAVAYAPEEGL